MKTLLFYCLNKDNTTLSYNDDWFDAFCKHPDLHVTACNLANPLAWGGILPALRSFELIVFLHSTNSNGIFVSGLLKKALLYRRAKLVVFVGNEYKLMPEKMSFLREIRADIVGSQLPQDIAEWLYEPCRPARALSLPHALNAEVFKPGKSVDTREIDIGTRAFEYPWYFGDIDRAALMRFFQKSVELADFKLDISFESTKRFSRKEWAFFLSSCRGTVSTEAGTSFLERDDAIRCKVNAFIKKFPTASFDDVYREFFIGYRKPVSGKAVAPRHFEAVGTKTVQIMLPGRFNDIFQAAEHYIVLQPDLSNLPEVIARFRDNRYCQEMVDRTYEYVLALHTHRHRVQTLLAALR